MTSFTFSLEDLKAGEARIWALASEVAENWRPVAGYEGLYEVSDLGRVRRLRYTNRMTDKLYDQPLVLRWLRYRRYPGVFLYDGAGVRRKAAVHILVAETFIGERPEGLQVCHLDGDSLNPRRSNLAYGTVSENQLHKHLHGTMPVGSQVASSKLTEQAVREIRLQYRANDPSYGARALAARYGVNHTTIQYVVAGKTWRHVEPAKAVNHGLA